MSEPLRTLIVEDRASDAKLVVRELERAGFDPKWKRVETEEQYVSHLEASPEVIVADYSMPKFGAMRALEVLQKKGLDIPFIIVSESIGEDIAVEAMRHGAADYLRKDRLGRLGPAVNNALEQSRSRKESELCTAELRSTHEQLRHLLAHSPAVIYSLKIEDDRVTPTVVSDNIERLLGVRVEQSTHQWWVESLHPDDRERVLNKLNESLSGDGYSMEYRLRHTDGSYHWVEDNNRVVRDAFGKATEAVGVLTDITDRKQVEIVLKESERRFREMLENVELIATTLDKDGMVTFCNDYLLRVTGWKREEVIGADWFSNFIPDANVAVKKVFFETIEAGEIPTHYENPIKTRTGELREIAWNNTMLRDMAGNIVGTASLGKDVTERNRAEVAARAGEAQIREQAKLLDLAHDAIMVRDMEDRVEFWNHGAEKLYGWTVAEVQGKEASGFLYKGEPGVAAAARAAVIENGKWTGECKHSCKDGGTVTVRSRWTLVRDELAAPKSILIINTDITEGKRTEEELASLHRRYQLILQSIGEGVHGIGLDGAIIFENTAAAKLLGRRAEDLIGRPAHETIHHSHGDGSAYPKEECPIYRTLRDGVVRHRSEEFFWRSDGSCFPVDYVSAPLRDERGEIAGGVVTFRDITERKEAEEALRRQEKQYRILFETHPNPTWVYDAKTLAFLAVNDAAVEHYGYSRDEFLEITICDIRPPEDIPALIEASNGTAAKGKAEQSRHGTLRHRKKSGEIIFADIYTTNIQFEGRAAHLAIAIDVTEKKKAGDAIRESEERMRAVLESALDCVITMDHQGRVVEFNPAAEKTFGYKRDGAIGQLLADLIIPPSLRERHQRGLAHYLSTGEAPVLGKRIELTGMRSDNSEFPIELAITRIGSQEPPMFTGFIRDITERTDAEKHLAQMEGRYRGLLEAAPDAMVVVNQAGEIVLLNLQAEKQFGYRRDELVGQKVKSIIPEGFAERLIADDLRSAEDALGQQIGTGIELTGRRKNGSDFPIEIMLSPLESADGILVTAAIRDISERKQAEERLREQADIISRAHDAIIVLNFKDQRITFWNSGAERLYGWSADDAIGRSIGELILADGKDREEPLKALASTGEFQGETKQVAKNGREIIVDSRATLIRNPDGTPRSLLLINTDVTEQKKLETHLLRAQRLESIGTLASGVAHDLNNILTPILTCAEVLKGSPMREDLPVLVSLIEESARRGVNVVKQVLTFARGIEGERVVIKPSHLIQEMIDIAQKTFPKTIEILGRYTDDLWSIECDPTQLHQVLLNLSVNARDAMPNGGSITINAENFDVDEHYASMTLGAKPGPHLMFRVTDTGAGMSRATIGKIFDPFFTTKNVGKGTGLGLSTVLGLVKSHGGFISVYSEIGAGTTFKIFLPAKVSDGSSQKSKMPPELLEGNGELVLVVDDEPGIVQMTKMILERRNYRVLTAEDGPDALALIAQQTEPIKVVLTDMSMPFMEGVVLIRAIKKMKPATMFIASTGQGEKTRMGELESLGVRNFLTKPYDTQTLLTTVRGTLSGAPSNPVS